jgi:hypothetical protein
MQRSERPHRLDPRLLTSAEEAGAAACRAGLPRDAVPRTFGDASTGPLSEQACQELARRWLWGWKCARVLRDVSERMFPATFSRSAMG